MDRRNVQALISLYEERPCLYDIKSKDYFNRDKRNKALQEVAESLGTTGEICSYVASQIVKCIIIDATVFSRI